MIYDSFHTFSNEMDITFSTREKIPHAIYINGKSRGYTMHRRLFPGNIQQVRDKQIDHVEYS